jgi:hypothetical protein
MHKTVVLSLALISGCATGAVAQQRAKASPTAAGLKQDIARVAGGVIGKSDAFTDLMDATHRRLMAYLKTHEVSATAAKNLGLGYTESSDANHLKVFTYSYSSGGTRGIVHQPILQWKDATGQLFAYSMNDDECDFSEIHKLAVSGSTLYLLLGGEQGNTQCYVHHARLVELKGNYLLLGNGAFNKKPALSLCNVEMKFDRAKQVLRLDLAEYSTEHDEVLPAKCYRTGAKSLTLRFVSGRFVKSR